MEQIENRMVVDSEWPAGAKEVCKCCYCEDSIYEGEEIYDIDGDIIHEDCLRDWARIFKKEAKMEVI